MYFNRIDTKKNDVESRKALASSSTKYKNKKGFVGDGSIIPVPQNMADLTRMQRELRKQKQLDVVKARVANKDVIH